MSFLSHKLTERRRTSARMRDGEKSLWRSEMRQKVIKAEGGSLIKDKELW